MTYTDIRCPNCRKIIIQVSPDPTSGKLVGIIEKICENSRCRVKSTFILWNNKAWLVNDKLLSKRKLLEGMSEEDTLKSFITGVLSNKA